MCRLCPAVPWCKRLPLMQISVLFTLWTLALALFLTCPHTRGHADSACSLPYVRGAAEVRATPPSGRSGHLGNMSLLRRAGLEAGVCCGRAQEMLHKWIKEAVVYEAPSSDLDAAARAR